MGSTVTQITCGRSVPSFCFLSLLWLLQIGSSEQVDLVGMWSVCGRYVVGKGGRYVVGNERAVVGKSSRVVGMWSVKVSAWSVCGR